MTSSGPIPLALLGGLLLSACSSMEDAGYGGAGGGGGQGGSGGVGGFHDIPLEVSAVAVGASHSCAVTVNGGVACWGSGARGQLGDGISGKDYHRAMAAPVVGISGAVGVRAGGDTTCAVLYGGGVWCWGEGAFGQLGDGVAEDGHLSAVPVEVLGLPGVLDLDVTAQTACAALADDTVRCWGRNSPDEWLGFASAECGPYAVYTGDGGPTLMTFPCEPTPRVVPGAIGADHIASGGEHTCALSPEGPAMCWGADHFGQLGDGQFGPDAHSGKPVEVQQLEGARQLGLGTSHTCAVVGPASKVLCWGDNSYGQLGIGSSALDSYKITPTEVPDLSGVTDLHASSHTTCASRSDGSVVCWGDTSMVLPPVPTKGISIVPTVVPGAADAAAVHIGGGHVCALRLDQTVMCWGNNDRGQLGNGTVGLPDFSLMPVAAPPGDPQ